MHLPDTFQPQLGQHVPYRLPAVALVAPEIVQIEQDSAVGLLSHGREELTVAELTGAWPQVVCGARQHYGSRAGQAASLS
jgi:hypothetical protein